MNKRRKNIFYTVIGCLLFLALPLIVSNRPPGVPAFRFTMPVTRDVITNAIMLVFFFINYDYLIPQLYFPKKYVAYGACIIFCFLCICLIPALLTGYLPPGWGNRPPGPPPPGVMEWRFGERDSGFAAGPRRAMEPGPPPGVMEWRQDESGPLVDSASGFAGQGLPVERGPGLPMERGQGPMAHGPDGVHGSGGQGGPGGRGGPGRQGGPGSQGPSWMVESTGFSFLQQINHSIYLYMAVIMFSILLKVRGRLFQLQKEKVDAELSSLKSQINPHFLFNTLNSIYALAVKNDEKTADAVINLAGLMRYMIKEAHGDRISLQKELDYLTNYVELQKARLRETALVSLSITGDPGQLEIAPLILITFVENAFKYGINPDMESRISIDIDIYNDVLELRVYNTKVLISSLDLSTGIGLDNTRSRLEKLYNRKHRLEISDEKDRYTIYLSIQLI